MKQSLLAVISMLIISSCSTVTISSKEKSRLSTEPTYETSLGFWLGGLVGEKEIDVTAPCNGAIPVQIQTQYTFVDALVGAITLSIYSPRSVRIWCPKKVN